MVIRVRRTKGWTKQTVACSPAATECFLRLSKAWKRGRQYHKGIAVVKL